MRLVILLALFACGAPGGGSQTPVSADRAVADEGDVMPATRLALVGLETMAHLGTLRDGASGLGGRVLGCFEGARVCWVRFPAAATLPLGSLARLPGVRHAEADAEMDLVSTVPTGQRMRVFTDPAPTADCVDPWEGTAIGLGEAWTLHGTRGGVVPVVSVMDSGFLTSHEEIRDAISGRYDYGNSDSTPEVEPLSGIPAHGTFISGMIAASHDNGVGRSGVVPEGRLNLQKIADNNGALFFSYAVRAMADAAEGDLGIRVVNYSIASSSTVQSFTDAVAALEDARIVLVVAAANCGSPSCSDADNDAHPLYPASFSFDHVITVGGALRDGTLNPYSHFGARSVDLVAPGVDLCGPGVLGDDDYYTAGGTSYATPLVSGTAALLLGHWPRLEARDVARVIRASAIPDSSLLGLVRSGGGLSAVRALQVAMPRLGKPVDRVVDRYGQLVFDLDNLGADGTATLVLTHPSDLEIVGAEDEAWTVRAALPGELVELPDAGSHLAAMAISVVSGPLPADASTRVVLDVRAHATGSRQITARLVATSPGAEAWLNAPYDQGSSDETGFLAWRSWVDVERAVPPAELGLEVTGALVPGGTLALDVTGAVPGQVVWFVGGLGRANSDCFPFDDQRCPHVLDPRPLASAVADAVGEASAVLRLPDPLPPVFELGFEAVAPAGQSWSQTVLLPLP